MKSKKGFTLIELMIVVAIIGILASIAIPKFADLVSKTKEAKTKANLGSIRSALSIYYSDNEGLWPQAMTDLVPKYLGKVPTVYTQVHGESTNIFNDND